MGSLFDFAGDFLFGDGLSESVYQWMNTLFDTIARVFENNLVGVSMNIFCGIAISLMLLYFMMDLTNQASKDMFSFEKLILAFIRLFVAFAVLLFLNDILTGLVHIGQAFIEVLNSGSWINGLDPSGNIVYEVDPKELGVMVWNPLKLIQNIGAFILAVICSIIGLVVRVISFFLCTTCALQIVVRGIASPLAVVQCFEDGTRSAGITFLKKFAAECLTMGFIILLLKACEALTANLVYDAVMQTYQDICAGIFNNAGLSYAETQAQIEAAKQAFGVNGSGTLHITADNFLYVMNFKYIGKILVPPIAAVGGMIGAKRISSDIFGVH